MITRKQYYSVIDIQYELIRQHIHKETMFLEIDKDKRKSPIRWLNASCLNFLKKHFDYFKFLEKHMNLYFSLATYKDFPMFSYNWRIKSQQQEIWLKEFHKHITKYDLFIETDCEDINIALEDSKEIKDFFDKHKIKYSIKFSGSKGFHFIVPYEEFEFLNLQIYNENLQQIAFNEFFKDLPYENKQDMIKNIDLVNLFKLIALRLQTMLFCDTIDTSVQDVKRVCKTAYSYDCKSGLIAYPLTDDMFYNFKKELVTPEKVLSYNNYRRGLLYRNENINKKERELGIIMFLKDLGIVLETFK